MRLGLVRLLVLAAAAASAAPARKPQQWSRAADRRLETDLCTIERVNASALTRAQLEARFTGERRLIPALVLGAFPPASDASWAKNWSRDSLLGQTLANPALMALQKLPQAQARIPPAPHWLAQAVPPTTPVLVLGTRGSGTLFHNHGAAYNVLAYGAKRWYLHPPGWLGYTDIRGDVKDFHKLKLTVATYTQGFHARIKPFEAPLECMQRAGEMMYVPTGWQHATLNTREAITWRVSACWRECADDGTDCCG